MYVVMGATGHIGHAVAEALLDTGGEVTAIAHDAGKAEDLSRRGARVIEADVRDPASLRAALRQGRRAFLLNPPAPVSGDTDREEHASAAAIVAALDGSGLEKAVVESTYGARRGDAIGDLSVLYDLEQALAAQPIPVAVLRAAYYMSNWEAQLDAARGGTLQSFFPADLAIPMVAPADLGGVAARLLQEPVERTGTHLVEGPERYTVRQVADAFAAALGRPVEVVVTPRDKWVETYRGLGFSAAAAAAYARMTAVSVDEGFVEPAVAERGAITIEAYIADLTRHG